ncbi:hypothetical protein MMC30_004013 [Trapelia coarctata]|nr:hypothetical protein [Trapelia coarctata]
MAPFLPLLPLLPLITAQTQFHSVFTPHDLLFCYAPYQCPFTPLPHDCDVALAMIPTGLSVLPALIAQHDPPTSPQTPITLALDKRLYTLPATFRSGTCVIRVWAKRQPASAAAGGKAASGRPVFESGEMYYKLWPRVREAVGEIVRRCVEGGPGPGSTGQGRNGDTSKGHKWPERVGGAEGGYAFTSTLQGHPVQWQVRVKWQDKSLRTDTWQPGDDHPQRSNVYNARKKADWAPGPRRHGMDLRNGRGGKRAREGG